MTETEEMKALLKALRRASPGAFIQEGERDVLIDGSFNLRRVVRDLRAARNLPAD